MESWRLHWTPEEVGSILAKEHHRNMVDQHADKKADRQKAVFVFMSFNLGCHQKVSPAFRWVFLHLGGSS